MPFLPRVLAIFACLMAPVAGHAQNDTSPRLQLELNTLQDTGPACRLTFVAQNALGVAIDQAVFETVVFDNQGSVVSLSLFDFRSLPAGVPRVRQFDLQGVTCADIGKVLINGTSTCIVSAADSDMCEAALELTSRVDVELQG